MSAPIASALVLAVAVAFAFAPSRARAQEATPVETDARRDPALIEALAAGTAHAVDGVCRVETSAGHLLGYGVAIEEGLVFTALDALRDLGREEGLALRGRKGAVSARVLARNDAFGVALLVATERAGLLRPVPRGDDAALAPGSLVAVVGTDRLPLAAGVVSALGRRVEASEASSAADPFGLLNEQRGPARDLARVIQHDAALTREMRGSALLDARGLLVGVNLGQVYRGSSFAVGLTDLLELLPDMREGRPGPDRPAAGWLGITLRPLERERREALGVAGLGAVIGEVRPESPAAAAGLAAGDLIRSIDGTPVEHPEALPRVLAGKPPGTRVRVVVLRQGETRGFDAVLGRRPPG